MTNPTKLGKYELDPTPIGRGAMGIVYKAFDPDLWQSVAIKVIRTEILEGPGEGNARLRFKNEAVAGRRLRHPNIVPVYDYGEEQECSYIVMAFVEGRRLKDVLDGDHRFSVPEALSIMDQLLEALDYAHRKNVVHRDIKPANILYGEDGRIQVADFGIAKVDASTLTRTGAVLGTPGYMAPEQWQGTPSDQRADLFAAGVILYELLTGEQPFRGSTGIATMQQVLSLEPVRPSQLNIQVPLVLDKIVAKAIAKRREERFPFAGEFASALKQALAQPALVRRRELESMPTIPGTVLGHEPRKKSKLGRGVRIVAGLFAMTALAAISIRMCEEYRPSDDGLGRSPGETAQMPVDGSHPSDGRPDLAAPTHEVLDRQVGAIVAGIECAALVFKITPSREVVLSGYLKPEDRDRVEQEVARVSGVKGVLFMAETLAWPYCELRELLGTYQSINSSRRNEHGHLSGVRLTPRRPDARYQEAERLVLTLTAPDLDSYLYVDYFLLDGSVVHLFPLTASERQPQQPSKNLALGQGDGKGTRQWEVSPPFGSEMLVAIAAQEPLFATPRPEMDTSKEYLLALSRALEQARSRGSVVLADLVPITTTPATQQNEAAGRSQP